MFRNPIAISGMNEYIQEVVLQFIFIYSTNFSKHLSWSRYSGHT